MTFFFFPQVQYENTESLNILDYTKYSSDYYLVQEFASTYTHLCLRCKKDEIKNQSPMSLS